MIRPKLAIAFISACSMFALVACSDEETAKAPPPEAPAPQEQPQATPPEKPAVETAKEGLDKLRDAANQLVEDAKPALDKARQSAEQAIKDAQPTIDRARDAAKKLGASIDEIVRQAQEDFKSATEQLDKHLSELQGERPATPTGDPAASLQAAEQLRTDTRAAARAATADIGPDYVGVWAGQAADCVKIDEEPLELFAVITPTTIRRYESVCNMAETPLNEGKAEIMAECVAEGDVEEQTLRLTLSTPERLTIAGAEGGGVDLVRCHLPE